MEVVSKVRLKLLVNKTNNKVLFAEAGKDFVDFLFYILSLPVGAVVKVLKKDNMGGSLGELYQSIEALSETYIQPNQRKSSVLNPKSPICSLGIPIRQMPDNESKPGKFYTCSNCLYSGICHVSDVPNVPCPRCNVRMKSEASYVPPGTASRAAQVPEVGFVKGVVSYMVKGNLEVTPMSTISCITLLNKFNIKDLGSVEERVTNFGIVEV
ncbi:DUF674 family protein [Melia azedarach]|uniref:DUF674 family protein n=1 Tax=Melia azedarach TaxID=155640 RepID=A0ACC1YK70_MELAZ|nr:DUF674 family protein [Melia azedarach]